MEADFTIHTGWGHLRSKPKVGDTLVGEFQTSFIKFEFTSVECPGSPPDLFFGKVKAIGQEMK